MSDSVPTVALPRAAEEPALPSDVLPRGATVGRYVIVDVVGEGGMGVVYAAYDSQLDRKVALKLLRQALVRGGALPEIESRLLREAQAMARLSHPNVVAVHDVGLHDHRVFLAMEYVEGETLKRWLKGEHSLRERLSVLRDAGKGLSAAHAAGLVHRDFKPDNVLVGKGGRVVVLDFGIACADTDSQASPPNANAGASIPDAEHVLGNTNDPLSSPLTLAGSILGTVGYMAPEQGLGDATTAATDQFSYAVTLHIALYREPPFPARSLPEYLDQIHKPIPPPKDSRGVPPWVRKIVLRALSADPKDRFPSLDAMLAALDDDPTLALRRGLVASAIVVALGTLGFALGRGLLQRESVCTADPAPLRSVWGEEARTRMMTAFTASGANDARARAERVAGKLDDFATDWTAQSQEVCRASRVRKTLADDATRLETDCLDRELTEARSITAMLGAADVEVVKRSSDIAYGLPQVRWCADLQALKTSAGLPDDPKKRARVLEVRAKLAEAESNWLAGKVKAAQERATEAMTLARAVGHTPTTAEAVFIAGRGLQRQGDYAEAAVLLREAALLASRSGADSIVVRAAGELAFVTGPELQHGDEARIWLDLSRAALDRMGGNEELELEVMRSEAGIVEELDLHPELAVPIGEKIAAGSRRLYGTHPKTALAVYNLGNSYATLGDPARAKRYLEEAVEMAEAVGGPTFPLLGWSDQMLGQVVAELGDIDRAQGLLERATAIFEQNDLTGDQALARERLAAIALVKGDDAEASKQSEAALTLAQAPKSPAYLIPIVNVTTALARLRSRKDAGAEALTLCDRALEEQEGERAIDPEKVYGWDALRCKGEALIALGRPAEAIPYLERSLRVTRRTFRGDYARAAFTLARALRDTHRDPNRAIALAEAARDELAKYAFLSWEMHRVERWLAAK